MIGGVGLLGVVLAGSAGASTFQVIHSFGGHADGAEPDAGLTAAGGRLYGATVAGGAGCGTVFSITHAGRLKTLATFDGTDGCAPLAGVVVGRNSLYAMTEMGGAAGVGTAVRIAGATVTPVHQFVGGNDGAMPVNYGAAPGIGGTAYITTYRGGSFGFGTVMAIAASGQATVLHAFGASATDGASPLGGLLALHGTLYGTTEAGGDYGYGTVFAITPAGALTVLHSFAGGADGIAPAGPLIAAGGTLYGTTLRGGAGRVGTVFSMTPAGVETVLHAFAGGPGDGANPTGGLLSAGGLFYGTTLSGGSAGGGTIYSLAADGTATVRHSFAGGTADGQSPVAGLTAAGGVLYGTTQNGGRRNDGTVFAFSP